MPTRTRRLPATPLDLAGIMPDIRVRKGEPDPVAFARRYLKSAPAAPTPEKAKRGAHGVLRRRRSSC